MLRKKFGEEVPLVRRHDVRGFVRLDPVQRQLLGHLAPPFVLQVVPPGLAAVLIGIA
jgi:hypothetical protein